MFGIRRRHRGVALAGPRQAPGPPVDRTGADRPRDVEADAL